MSNQPRIIPEYRKQYTLGKTEKKQSTLTKDKEKVVQDILALPAVSMRGDRDELIEHIPDATPPLQWKEDAWEALMNSDLGYLITLRNLIQKRVENGKKSY